MQAFLWALKGDDYVDFYHQTLILPYLKENSLGYESFLHSQS